MVAGRIMFFHLLLWQKKVGIREIAWLGSCVSP
jgi:hypothetical protein